MRSKVSFNGTESGAGRLIDFILDLLFTPFSLSLWLGTALGVLAASAAWFMLPATADRASAGALCVVVGFFAGLVLGYLTQPPRTR